MRSLSLGLQERKGTQNSSTQRTADTDRKEWGVSRLASGGPSGPVVWCSGISALWRIPRKPNTKPAANLWLNGDG